VEDFRSRGFFISLSLRGALNTVVCCVFARFLCRFTPCQALLVVVRRFYIGFSENCCFSTGAGLCENGRLRLLRIRVIRDIWINGRFASPDATVLNIAKCVLFVIARFYVGSWKSCPISDPQCVDIEHQPSALRLLSPQPRAADCPFAIRHSP
jgi:hypothetical protein